MLVILFKLEVLSSRAQQVAIGSGVTMQEKDALPSGVLTLSILEVKGRWWAVRVSLRDVHLPYRLFLLAADTLLKYMSCYVAGQRPREGCFPKQTSNPKATWAWKTLSLAVSTLNLARPGRSVRCDLGSAKQALRVCNHQVDELGKTDWRDPLSNQWLSGKLKIGKLSALMHLDTWWI